MYQRTFCLRIVCLLLLFGGATVWAQEKRNAPSITLLRPQPLDVLSGRDLPPAKAPAVAVAQNWPPPMPAPLRIIRAAAPEVKPVKPEADLAGLQRQFLHLKQTRRQLQAEREQVVFDSEAGAPPESSEAFRTRLHLAELLIKLAAQNKLKKAASQEKTAPRPPSETGSSQKPKIPPIKQEKPIEPKVVREPAPLPEEPKPEPSGKPPTMPATGNKAAAAGGSVSVGKDKPVDPVALAEALFRTGDYEGALAAYRLLDLHSLGRSSRVGAQYMMACCLRKLGKTDDAASLYREVANSKDDEILADCAQWQLGALRWRHDLESQLRQVQQRRQALEVKP
jgi:hypothetical protein